MYIRVSEGRGSNTTHLGFQIAYFYLVFFNVASTPPIFDNLISVNRPDRNVRAQGGSKETERPEETPRLSYDGSVVGLPLCGKLASNDEDLLLPELTDTATGICPAMAEPDANAQKRNPVCDPIEQEVITLQNVVRVLGERERNLKIQLLEYYGLKEQETAVRELENKLKINNMETKVFTLKIQSLQAENKRLEAYASDQSKILAELESARAKIKQLKKKLRSEGEQNRDQLAALQQRVRALQEEERQGAQYNADILKKIQRLKDLEEGLAELKQKNSKLEHDNSELAMKLESARSLTCSVIEGPEVKALEEEAKRLREANGELEKQIEVLRANRSANAEELVYLRWVNACLRHELRNHPPPPGKTTARDLSKTLSPKSQQKAKQLIHEYASAEVDGNGVRPIDLDSEYCSSSQASTLSEAGDCDDSSLDLSSNNRSRISNKLKFLRKLKRLVSGKESHSHHNKYVVSFERDSSYAAAKRGTSGSVSSLDDPIDRSLYDTRPSWTPQLISRSKSVNNLNIMPNAIEKKSRDGGIKNMDQSTAGTPEWSMDTSRQGKSNPKVKTERHHNFAQMLKELHGT